MIQFSACTVQCQSKWCVLAPCVHMLQAKHSHMHVCTFRTGIHAAASYHNACCAAHLSAAASRVHAQPGLPAPPNHWLRLNPYMLEDSPHHSHAQGLAGHIGVKTHSCSVKVLQHTTVALAVGGAVPPSAPEDPAAVAFEPCCSVPAPRVNPPGPQVKGGGFTAPALRILLKLVWD
jgi:hypothetical protein